MQKITVLSSEYTIEYKDYNDFLDFKILGACGFCNTVTKVISVCNIKTNPDFSDVSDEYEQQFKKEILRHEILHAFLFESGLSEDSQPTGCG